MVNKSLNLSLRREPKSRKQDPEATKMNKGLVVLATLSKPLLTTPEFENSNIFRVD